MAQHADRGQNPIIRRNLDQVHKTAKEMKTILDSLAITAENLKDSKWSDRRRDLTTFNGPFLSPTRRKVNNLCNREWEKLYKSLNELTSSVDKMEAKNDFKKLLTLWKNNQKNIEVYGSYVLRELCRSEECAVYRALTQEGLQKPQATLDKIHEVVVSFRKLMNDIEEYSKQSINAFAAEGIKGLLKV